MMMTTPQSIVGFWRAAGESRWFHNDPLFDAQVRRQLGHAHEAAADGMLDDWIDSPEGALALLILLDQVPRNIFRGTPSAFETDDDARFVAEVSLGAGYDRRVPKRMRGFFYLPFMHSENLADQERCVALYEELKNPVALRYAQIHYDAIRRFGRFPHRNPILGREMTPEEQRYLDEGGFSG